LSFQFLLPALPSSLHHLLASLAVLCNRKYPSRGSSCQVQLQLYFRLHRLQLSSTNFQVQLLAVLPNFSGFNCLLPAFKFNCNCTSVPLRLQLSSTFFQGQRLFFSEFLYLINNIYLLSLSNSLSMKNLEKFIFNY
jgi:hypothetical protein